MTMNTADSWSRVVRHLSLEARPRHVAGTEGAVSGARIHLTRFLETGEESYLEIARALLPGCQTADELAELSDVLDCSDGCSTTCGSPVLAPLVCVVFFGITALVMLNLLLAALMQSLQEHQQRLNNLREDDKMKPGDMSLLMNVSRAAAGWRQAHTMRDKDSDDSDEGPVNAGVSPMARAGIRESSPPMSRELSASLSPMGQGLRSRGDSKGDQNSSQSPPPSPQRWGASLQPLSPLPSPGKSTRPHHSADALRPSDGCGPGDASPVFAAKRGMLSLGSWSSSSGNVKHESSGNASGSSFSNAGTAGLTVIAGRGSGNFAAQDNGATVS